MDRLFRKPLANGFEFGSGTDLAYSRYHSRDGFKNDKDDKVDFKLKFSNRFISKFFFFAVLNEF
jgi:hypothetical protein